VADAEPSIRSVKVDGSYSRGGEQFANVTVQLQDVPDEHHHQWLQFLNEDFSRRDPADPAASWGPRMFDLAGVVHLHPPLYATGSAEILGELRDAIARTQDRYRHWLTTESERQADAQAAVEPYREQLLTQAADGVAVIEEVRGRASEGRFVGRFEQLVSLRVRLDESRVSYELLHELLNEAHIPARPRWFREGDVFSIPLEYANPHDLHEEFAQAVAKAAETAERREQEVAQREQRLRVLQEAFDESL
jgi:hypothetical protein